MKQIRSDAFSVKSLRLLLLSDTKPGHVNQSIAFARHLGYEYDLVDVNFRFKWLKGISYLAGRFGVLLRSLIEVDAPSSDYAAVVSAGSGTYYANRVLAQMYGCKSIAIMLPQGYGYEFDLIVAQEHDKPPKRRNLLCLPVNLSFVEPQGLVWPESGCKYVSIIVGGDSKQNHLDAALLCRQIEQIRGLFPGHRFWLTTSRRTPDTVEEMLQNFNWDEAIYFSRRPANPIPDFLAHSDYVFVTADSSSMISEAVAFGDAAVEVLPLSLEESEQGKFGLLLKRLSEMGCLHRFDGQIGNARVKIALSEVLKRSVDKILQ